MGEVPPSAPSFPRYCTLLQQIPQYCLDLQMYTPIQVRDFYKNYRLVSPIQAPASEVSRDKDCQVLSKEYQNKMTLCKTLGAKIQQAQTCLQTPELQQMSSSYQIPSSVQASVVGKSKMETKKCEELIQLIREEIQNLLECIEQKMRKKWWVSSSIKEDYKFYKEVFKQGGMELPSLYGLKYKRPYTTLSQYTLLLQNVMKLQEKVDAHNCTFNSNENAIKQLLTS